MISARLAFFANRDMTRARQENFPPHFCVIGVVDEVSVSKIGTKYLNRYRVPDTCDGYKYLILTHHSYPILNAYVRYSIIHTGYRYRISIPDTHYRVPVAIWKTTCQTAVVQSTSLCRPFHRLWRRKTVSEIRFRSNRKWKYGGNCTDELAAINFLFDLLYIMGSISTPSATL